MSTISAADTVEPLTQSIEAPAGNAARSLEINFKGHLSNMTEKIGLTEVNENII
jgi:hypothetical protein